MLVKVTRKIRWGLQMVGKRPYQRIFELYVDQKIDFIDAYNPVHMQKRRLSQINSCDSDFDRIVGSSRAGP
jgi:predicted nucleic acid-binding protein